MKKTEKGAIRNAIVVNLIFAIIVNIAVWGVAYATKVNFNFNYAIPWLIISIIAIPIISLIANVILTINEGEYYFEDTLVSGVGAAIAVFLIFVIGYSFSTSMYHANYLYKQSAAHVEVIEDETDVFPELIKNGDTSNLPVYGQEEAYKKASAELAKDNSLGSRIAIDKGSFMSQEINGKLTYTAETEPRSFWKRNAELRYYTVNRNNGSATANQADDFIVAKNKWYGKNALRYLQKQYRSKYISDITLEIDSNGNPMYVASVLNRHSGIKFDEVIGAIVLDPKTGVDTFYGLGKEPKWVDRVYPESVLVQYITYWGKYKNGFWNGNFAQKDVLDPTSVKIDETEIDNVEVVYIDNEPFIWTGMNSAQADDSADSNGIILASLKTGKIFYYKTSGVSEQHACEVASGLIQEKGYTPGYPIPLKVSGVQALFMILRDNSNNIMGYALVNYKDYTQAAYSEKLENLVTKFLAKTQASTSVMSDEEIVYDEGKVLDIATEVVDGRTMYYIKTNDGTYSTTSSIAPSQIPFLKIGDTVKIGYAKQNSEVIPIKTIEFVK